MFDIGASELLLTVIVAIVVIGPKDLPRALRLAGSWLGKIRRVSGHFRSGIEEMIRQAELEDMEKKWLEKNAAIMQQEVGAEPVGHAGDAASPESALPQMHALGGPSEAHLPGDALPDNPAQTSIGKPATDQHSPELPLTSPKAKA